MEEERTEAKARESDYHEKIDGLDKEIFTLTECVEVSESHAEDLQNELIKERARSGKVVEMRDNYVYHKPY
jgi:DNA phosphorothioation-dependent restriction protein DptG